jgi:hypothetical protein
LYDRSIQKPDNYEWISSEFTPDGRFIVSQLDYDFYYGDESDSIYIHDANTFEIYDVFLNNYIKSTSEVIFNHLDPLITVNNNSSLTMYNLNNKSIDSIHFEKTPKNVIFSRFNKCLLLRLFTSLPTLFDYERNLLKDEIGYLGIPQLVTIDDNLLYKNPDGKLALVSIDWNKTTNISTHNTSEITISPNPTKGVVNFSLICSEPELVYSIYSSVVAVLASDTKVNQGRDVSIDFSAYPTGVYFVSFLCNGELKTYKIIKEG